MVLYVERNLGFEAEHFQRALCNEDLVHFYRDEQAGRTGILTTETVKLAALPGTTEPDAGVAATAKPGGALTVSVDTAVWVTLPLVPLTVKA